MIDYEELAEAMGDLDEDTVKELLETVMADGGSGAQQAMDACQKGMDIVGSRFESGEYFVGDLIYAGELMTDYDKLIDRQLERASISAVTGFAKIFSDASKKLTIS